MICAVGPRCSQEGHSGPSTYAVLERQLFVVFWPSVYTEPIFWETEPANLWKRGANWRLLERLPDRLSKRGKKWVWLKPVAYYGSCQPLMQTNSRQPTMTEIASKVQCWAVQIYLRCKVSSVLSLLQCCGVVFENLHCQLLAWRAYCNVFRCFCGYVGTGSVSETQTKKLNKKKGVK